jgi:hypothetical protein
MAIYLEAHVMTFIFQQICYQRKTIKNIDVIVASWEPKKSVPEPKRLVHYCFKDSAPILLLVLKLPLPS